MKNRPLFSIIIPLYNKEIFIENTLKCVLNQTFVNFEVLIINDGSTDKSVEIVSQYKDSRLNIFHQTNQGASSARNKGIELARGKYITFLDADDYWRKDFLEVFYHLINKFPKQKVFSAAIKIETSYNIIKAKYSLSNEVEPNIFIENYFKGSMKYSLICTSCAVFNKEIFNKVGIFDREIPSGQDIDLWIRIGMHYQILFFNKVLAHYVMDINSLSRNKKYKQIKMRFQKYEEQEKKDIFLKKFLDYNRYSEALTNKIEGNHENFSILENGIAYENLSLKQKILINSPQFMLKNLVRLQPVLIKLKLRNSVYK